MNIATQSSFNNGGDGDIDALFVQIYKDLECLNKCGQYGCTVCGGCGRQKHKTFSDDETEVKKFKQNAEERTNDTPGTEKLTVLSSQKAPKHAIGRGSQSFKCSLLVTNTSTTTKQTKTVSVMHRVTAAATYKPISEIWAWVLSRKQLKSADLCSDNLRRNVTSLHEKQILNGLGGDQENIQKVEKPGMELGREVGQEVANPEVDDLSERPTPVKPPNAASFINLEQRSDKIFTETKSSTPADSRKPTAVVLPTISKTSKKSSASANTARSTPNLRPRRSTLNASTARQALAAVDQNVPARMTRSSTARQVLAPLDQMTRSSTSRQALASVDQNVPAQKTRSSTARVARVAPAQMTKNVTVLTAKTSPVLLGQTAATAITQTAPAPLAPTAPAIWAQTSTAIITPTSPATLAHTVPAASLSSIVQNSSLLQISGQPTGSPTPPVFVPSVVTSDFSLSHRLPSNTVNNQPLRSPMFAAQIEPRLQDAIEHYMTSRPSPISQRAPTAGSQSSVLAAPSNFISSQNINTFNRTPALVIDNTGNIIHSLYRLVQEIPGVQQNVQRTRHGVTAPWSLYQ